MCLFDFATAFCSGLRVCNVRTPFIATAEMVPFATQLCSPEQLHLAENRISLCYVRIHEPAHHIESCPFSVFCDGIYLLDWATSSNGTKTEYFHLWIDYYFYAKYSNIITGAD